MLLFDMFNLSLVTWTVIVVVAHNNMWVFRYVFCINKKCYLNKMCIKDVDNCFKNAQHGVR